MSESDPLQKINWCLRVNETDPTKGRALQEINSCLWVKEIDSTKKKNTVKNKYASRSPKSTSIMRAPTRRDANQNQKGKLEN